MNRFWLGLPIILFLSLVACVQVTTISCGGGRCAPPPPSMTSDVIPESLSPEIPEGLAKVIPPSHPPATVVTGERGASPLCQLNPPLPTFQKQDNSAWCWAASTTLIINHLDPNHPLKQCETVQTTLAPEREQYEEEVLRTTGKVVSTDCCLVTDKALEQNPGGSDDDNVKASIAVCHTTFRPEWALNALGYKNRYQIIRWPLPGRPGPNGLTWDELTGQICSNRPFISVKAWDEGGTHTEAITGYHYDPTGPMVDLDTHGMDKFYTIPFHDYQEKPGEYIHVRDYYDIGLQ